MKQKHTLRSFVYLTIGLAMLFYALPRIPHGTGPEKAFTFCWLAFALLFIGANLYSLIGADREAQAQKKRRARLERRIWELSRSRVQTVNRKQPNDSNRRRFMS